MNVQHLSWWLYLVGSALVFGSWIDVVPTGLAWIGWLMALAGWAVGARTPHDGRVDSTNTADQIEKLDQLRQRQVITAEEFEQEKRRVLDQPPMTSRG